MRKILAGIVASAAMIGFSGAANAALIDFGAEAEFNGERGFASGTVLGPTAYIGIAIDLVSAFGVDSPYLDGPGGSEPTAGLGVCGVLDASNQCDPSSDDNITTGEGVSVGFLGEFLDVLAIAFRGEGHIDFNSNDVNTLLIGTNRDNQFTRYTFAGAVAAALGGAFLAVGSIEFLFDDATFDAFIVNTNGLDRNADQFYIASLEVSDIPIPAALPLLLSGLAGLGFASRRKRVR